MVIIKTCACGGFSPRNILLFSLEKIDVNPFIRKKLVFLFAFAFPFGFFPNAQSIDEAFYPKQNTPFGYGIFEMMHWRQMEQKPDANIDNPYLGGALFHLPWAMLEPSPGKLDTTFLDRLLRMWTSKGKKIILQFKTSPGGKEKNPFKESSTPAWVYDEGAKYVQSTKGGLEQRIPIIWDPTFLKKYEQFVQKLAEKYDGHPGIEFIIVGPGVFGSTRANYPKMMKKVASEGYSDEVWYKANAQIMDIYRNAFHKTPLALGLAPYKKNLNEEEKEYNHLALATLAIEKGFYLFYHNLRGTDEWLNSPYPRFFASLGTKTKIALGLDNPTSMSEHARKKYGDPMTIVRYAFGGQPGIDQHALH